MALRSGPPTADPRLPPRHALAIFLARALLADWDPPQVLDLAIQAEHADPGCMDQGGPSIHLALAAAAHQLRHPGYCAYFFREIPDTHDLIRQRRASIPGLLACPDIARFCTPEPWMRHADVKLHIQHLSLLAIAATTGLLLTPYSYPNVPVDTWACDLLFRSTLRTFEGSRFGAPPHNIAYDALINMRRANGRTPPHTMRSRWDEIRDVYINKASPPALSESAERCRLDLVGAQAAAAASAGKPTLQ